MKRVDKILLVREEHNGDVDIHFNSINVVEKGKDTQHEVKKSKVYSAIALAILTSVVSFITYKKVR